MTKSEKINKMADRIIEEIIYNDLSNELVFKIQCLAQKAKTGDMSDFSDEDPFEDYSQEDAKQLAKCILEKTERKLRECERSYYATACLLGILSELNELENLQYTNKRIEICKTLFPLFINAELDIEVGILKMKILD